jgi:hypothetical protein
LPKPNKFKKSMTTEFENLSESEKIALVNAPALVTILIAGADEEISKRELQEAISLTRTKQKNARKELLSYYNMVSPHFEENLNQILQKHPENPEVRSKLVIEELVKLNEILAKMDKRWASQFVESMRDIAKKVAESAGGVFGYLSIGYEESKLIGLKMLKIPA